MSNITLQLIDSVDNVTYDLLEVPLQIATIDGKSTVETLDGSVFTFVTYKNKFKVTHTWANMTKDDYDRLKAIERRQYDTFLRPLLTIDQYNIDNVPVVMDITTPRNIVSNCGTVNGVTVTFRETKQNSIGD